MKIILIVVIVLVAIYSLSVWFVAIREVVLDYKNDKPIQWWWFLMAPFLPVLIFILFLYENTKDYICDVWKDGGLFSHYRLKKYRKAKEEVKRRKMKRESAEYDRVKTAYLNGEIARTELPRVEDGVNSFEFSPEMGLYVDYDNEVREIVYVEREYNERLNRFFQEHKDLRLYHMYKFIYLPNLCKELEDNDYLHFLFPNASPDKKADFQMDSSYPLQYLVYSEDISKIQQGMFFFRGGMDNHGAEYIEGDYLPLLEGSDEEIIQQLTTIIKQTHSKHSRAALYSTVDGSYEDKASEDHADEKFYKETTDEKVAKLVEEVREKIKMLQEYGLPENMLMNLLKEKPKLSRLVVTKDMRIVLPDYNDMEIKMEPINKAVYLLFLNHPEGIIFKCLPDHRNELADIYQKIKPLGLNERALQSIEDVTNPLLNSINEKCARIKGAFISKFNKNLAMHYYITGWRGEAKKITLPKDLVIWE